MSLQLADRSVKYPRGFIEDEAMKDPLEATLTTELKDDELHEEKYEIVAYFKANHPQKKPVRMKLEYLGDRRDLTPQKSSIEEPPTLELKSLPPHLKYMYLDENNKLPVIIYVVLTDAMDDKLLNVLKEHKRAFAWKVAHIKGINSSIFMHKILMEEKYSPLVQIWRILNPKMKDNRAYLCSLLLHQARKFKDNCRHMSFGLCNALATFQRCMTAIFYDMIETFLVKFMYDFSIFGATFDECLQNLNLVLMRYKETNLAYDNLKDHLVTAPILVAPNWDLPFEVMFDASDTVVGAVLGQRRNKVLHTIYYASKTLDEARLNYATTESELIEVVFALDKFHSYIILSKVIVFTDHSGLKCLLLRKRPNHDCLGGFYFIKNLTLK
ncbi:uncharacterized protein [Primulina eburnea]|uniref:uncharacterized protein n=1 Tax=Primulina eburnea TaxID=1245227 RepID=UPI003C6C9AAE